MRKRTAHLDSAAIKARNAKILAETKRELGGELPRPADDLASQAERRRRAL